MILLLLSGRGRQMWFGPLLVAFLECGQRCCPGFAYLVSSRSARGIKRGRGTANTSVLLDDENLSVFVSALFARLTQQQQHPSASSTIDLLC